MAASLRLSRTPKSRIKTAISFACCLLPNLSSSTFFSTLCRKNRHFKLLPAVHQPPVAKKVPFTANTHGVKLEDPYRWMSDLHDPDFISYLNNENSYAEEFMRDTEKMQRTLYAEMISRMPSKISTPPESWGPWFYYQCVPEGKEYPVFCRKSAVERKGWVKTVFGSFGRGFGKEQVLLDWNEIAEKHGYVHVGTCRISPDHNFLAYTLDTSGNEQFQLQIKDLRTDTVLPHPRVEGVLSLAWSRDSSTLFYTLCDENQRPFRVLCTNLDSDYGEDTLIFTENDSRFCVDIASTKDGKFVTVNSNSRTSSEEGTYLFSSPLVYVIDATNPQTGLRRFCKRVSGVQYFLEHHHRFFYVLTNAPTCESKNFSDNGYYLARCGDDNAQSANLKNVIVPGEGICLEDMDMFNEHLVLFLNREGSPLMCSINVPVGYDCEKGTDIDDFDPWYFPLPSNMCTITPGSNHDFMNTVFRAVLSSPVTPDLLIDYDMSRKKISIVQQDDVRNVSNRDVENCSVSYSHEKTTLTDTSHKETARNDTSCRWKDFSEKYSCEVKEVVSHDDVRIPLLILFSRSAYRKGQSPGLLHVYGSYGEGLDKSWCPDRLSLLDRGWMFAFADVRGGAGGDPSWHKSGRGLKKLNSIHDFISCSEYLINEGFINQKQLSALGISAGCLVVAAAINMRPELFRAVVLKVPFLDVLNTLSDPQLPLTTLDYEEFGDPRIKSCFEYILKYSPYENIPRGICCPSMLVSASFNDSRVGIWEAAKWVAKTRDSVCSNCSSSVILQTDMNGGHLREGGRFAHCLETAYDYAFLMKVMNETKNGA